MSSAFARAWQRLFGAIVVGSVALLTQCHVDDALDERPWPCDSNALDCGTFDGKPMICWEGFCMPACDYAHPPPAGSGVECLFGGVLVRTCDPSPDENLGAECSPGFHCYRTDLLFNQGICVPFPVCSESSECTDPRHNVCASDSIREITGDVEVLALNGLICLTDDCKAHPEICGDDVCLGTYYELANHALPDICVPRCDGAGQCLPNYTCANSDAAPGADRICIPGFPGVRCEHEQDCAFGWCLQTAADFKICSITCQDDESCKFLNSDPTYYRCIDGEKGGKLCATTSPFQGLRCEDGRECTGDARVCTSYSPYLPTDKSECRPACDADGRCPPRAGLAQVCLKEDLTCYPGLFSIPCQESAQCLTPFSCHDVAYEERDFVHAEKICTIACETDLDCQPDPDDPHRLDRQRLGYCDGSFCRIGGLAGAPCERAEHCRNYKCDADSGVCR